MARLAAALKELQQERARAMHQVKRLDAVIVALGKLARRNGGKVGTPKAAVKRRTLSAAARRKIAAAQKARWAKWKAAKAKKTA
jgi:hypothetical protein